MEETDFMQTMALRQAIHAREGGQCFYCLRRLTPAMQGLDHVVPRARSGSSSYRNLVSCCLECNSRKGETPASDFVRWLYREGRLMPAELTDRLRALEDLASGKLSPALVVAGFSPSSSPYVAAALRRAPLECGSLTPLFRHPRFSAMDQASALREAGSHQASADSASVSTTAPTETASVSTTALAEMERMTILRVYEQARGDKALACKMLGISRATLYRKLKRYNISMKDAIENVAPEPQPPS
jgi:DNA-binding protein Fis